MVPLLIPLVAVSILGAVLGLFALAVIGIRRDDRAKTLTQPPDSAVAAATRRLVGVGTRGNHANKEKEA